MSKALYWVLAVSLISIAGNASAQKPTPTVEAGTTTAGAGATADPGASEETRTEDRFAGRDEVPLNQEAMRLMTREERRAAMRAYKAARSAEANFNGIKVTSDRRFVRLDPPRRSFSRLPEAPGTRIRYDSGDVIGVAGAASRMVGNRFDSAVNPAGTACCFPVGQQGGSGAITGHKGSGSITMITFDMVNTYFGNAVWSLYSDITGTQAKQVTAVGRSVMVGLNTLSVMSPTTYNAYANGSFLAGIWQFSQSSTGLAIDTGSVGGQGYHAISLNDGTTGSSLEEVTTGDGMGANAVFRVSGSVATPVELMSFSIED